MIEVVLEVAGVGRTVEIALDRVELDVEQPRGVVSALQEGADAHEVQRLVLQHGADLHPARQMRAELDPLEQVTRILLESPLFQHPVEFQPGLVGGLPDLGGQRTAHGTGVFTGCAQARQDARRVGLVAHHELHDLAGIDGAVAFLEGAAQLRDAQQAAPAQLRNCSRLRQQRGLVVHVEHARGVLGALHVARHPEQVISGS